MAFCQYVGDSLETRKLATCNESPLVREETNSCDQVVFEYERKL